jgi:HlyD family secretion protein
MSSIPGPKPVQSAPADHQDRKDASASQAEPASLPLKVVRRESPGAAAARGRLWTIRARLRSLALGLVLLAAGVTAGVVLQERGLVPWPVADPRPAVQSAPAGTGAVADDAGPVAVYGLGRLLPDGFVVTVAPPFGAGDARMAKLMVAEGDRVAEGDLLAELDNRPMLEAAVLSAEANVRQREAELAQRRVSVAASLAESRAALDRALFAAATAQREFARAEELLARGHVTRATHDERAAERDAAQRAVESARATLSRYAAEDPDAQADIAVARSNLDAARATLAVARGDLAKSVVRAPMDGVVLDIHVRPGERPGTDGILDMGEVDRMVAEVEVYQSRIGAVEVGDRVEITSEAFAGTIPGRVERIGWDVGRQTATGADPAARTDARVVKVYVRIDPQAVARVRRLTNLQVAARIETGNQPSDEPDDETGGAPDGGTDDRTGSGTR